VTIKSAAMLADALGVPLVGLFRKPRTKQPGPGRRRSAYTGPRLRQDRAAFVGRGNPAKIELAQPSPASACEKRREADAEAEYKVRRITNHCT